MGNLECCGERPESAAKAAYRRERSEASNAHILELMKLNEALSNKDIPALVSFLRSDMPFEVVGALSEIFSHPWAEPPASVAALAATQLASIGSEDDGEAKRRIVAAGAIPDLLRMTQGPVDQRESALVALTFLTSPSEAQPLKVAPGAEQLSALGAMPQLIHLIEKPPLTPELVVKASADITTSPKAAKVQARLAAAQICKNMYIGSLDIKKTFMLNGGVLALIRLLRDIFDDMDAKLECLYLLDDLIADPSSPELIKDIFRVEGLRETLIANTQLDDEELNATAQTLLQAFQA